MKYLIYIYYGSILLTGGIRSYSEEILLHETCLNLSIPSILKQYVFVSEYLLIACSLIVLIFPFNKWMHLLYGIIIFSVDFIFENFICFQKYIIIINFFPLILFFALHFKNSESKIKILESVLIRIIAIGYIAAFFAKVSSGWLNYSEPIIYGHAQMSNIELSTNFKLPKFLFFFNELYLKINFHFIHKMVDYLVLLFQLSAIVLFFKVKHFKYFSLFCALFHITILLILGIGNFYVYLLVYSLIIIIPSNLELNERTSMKERIIVRSILVSYIVGLTLNGFDKGFLYKFDFLYTYSGFILTITSIIVFLVFWIKKYGVLNKVSV